MDTRFVHGLPISCSDYPIRHCLGFQPLEDGSGIRYKPGGFSVPLLVIARLRHLSREEIATDSHRLSLPKASTITPTMTQKTKLNPVFHLSSEQLESRVNLSATAYGVDRHLRVPAPRVSQVKVVPHNYSVVMPHVKAAAAKTVTIPAVGQSGTFQWNWQTDHSLRVQLGNLRGTFTSVNQDGWNGTFSYKAKLAGGTSLTHTFNMSFSHDRDAEEGTLTYDDAKNHLSTTFDEAAAVSTTASGTSIKRPNGTVETHSVSGTSSGTVKTNSVSGTSAVTHVCPGGGDCSQANATTTETSNADGSTTVTSTKPRTLGTTLDDVKSLMTGLKASLDKSFRTAVPTVYPPSVPGRLSKMAAPATARVHIAVGWNAMQAVQTLEAKAGTATALSTRLANKAQGTVPAYAAVTITSFPYSYSYNKSNGAILLQFFYNGQVIDSFTKVSGGPNIEYSGDGASNMAGTQGEMQIGSATNVGAYVFNCNGVSGGGSTQLTITVTDS